jgi:hypothetical protein
MPDHLAHLQHPSVVDADAAWTRHVRGADGEPGCPECQHGERRACPVGRELHNRAVVAAQDAYREAHPEAFDPPPHLKSPEP